METLAFIGGTGPQGRGMGMRLARAGHRVLIGSRAEAKAQDAVGKIAEKVADLPVEGMTNESACEAADVIVVTVPYEAQAATLAPFADLAAGKIVVSCVAPLGFDAQGPHPIAVPAGSAAQECQELLPDAIVVGAFQNVSAVKLQRPDETIEGDVLLTGDDADARDVVAGMVQRVPGMRAVHAGPLRLSRPIEEMTAVLISVNKRYGIHSSLKVAGL
jgi:8-hydroxy-5-deazaflavin:NADPH oxidoreductase